MRREISWGEEAISELEAAREQIETHVRGRGMKFIEAVDATLPSLMNSPLQGATIEAVLDSPIRRVQLRAFRFVLYYIVYPSVNFQTGETLDVVHFLACRHEK